MNIENDNSHELFDKLRQVNNATSLGEPIELNKISTMVEIMPMATGACSAHTAGCQTVCSPTHAPCSPFTRCTPALVATTGLGVGEVARTNNLQRLLTALTQLDTSQAGGINHTANHGSAAPTITTLNNRINVGNRITAESFNSIASLTTTIQNRFCNCVNNACTGQATNFCRCHTVCSCNQVCSCNSQCTCNIN